MVNASDFFVRPAYSMCEIYSQVFGIFIDHFKTFAVLAALQSVALLPVLFVFVIVVMLMFAAEFAVISNTMNDGVRRLYESSYDYSSSSSSSYGSSSSSNSNGYDYSYSSNSYGDDIFSTSSNNSNDFVLPPGFGGFLFSVVTVYFVFLGLVVCISAAFQGAFVRAAGEVFAGRNPTWGGCLSIGWKKACSIVGFGMLIIMAYFGSAVVWFGLTVGLPLAANKPSFLLFFLSAVCYLIAIAVFGSSMVASTAAIMVENKGAVAAFTRSWNLCKSSVGFIFCCTFVFYFCEGIGKSIVNNILTAILSVEGSNPAQAAAISGGAAWVMALVLGPINALLNPVIYFSLRIRKEGLTMEELQGELSLLDDHSVELRSGDGIYRKVGKPVDDIEKTPIANATAV